ncbi:hypothetical protein IWW43_003295, partial [Coemansia sp. RSA 1935]
SNRDAKPESEPTLYIEPTPPDSRDGQKTADLSPDVRETNGAESSSLSSVESDVYEEEDSDNDSDFSGDGPFVVITKTARHTGKGTAVAAKATSKKSPISNVKAAAPRKAPGASLKDLLKGSSVPRAGISRRTLLKKVA